MNGVTHREKIYRVIFGTDTPAGQRFDIALIYIITERAGGDLGLHRGSQHAFR
jgi:hypothetical protein